MSPAPRTEPYPRQRSAGFVTPAVTCAECRTGGGGGIRPKGRRLGDGDLQVNESQTGFPCGLTPAGFPGNERRWCVNPACAPVQFPSTGVATPTPMNPG
jgi:hypothetical protein